MKRKRIFEFVLAGTLVLALSGCPPCPDCNCCYPPCPPAGGSLTPTMEGSAEGEYAFLWLAADKDAWVGCTDQYCADGDHNHGTLFSLDVAAPTFPPGIKRIYVEFYLPELPPDTWVVEAY